MGLSYHPKPGEIFMCEFPSEYLHGEMIKKRPVIILNNKIDGRPKLVNIVPISMTAPDPVCAHHVDINRMYLPKGLRDKAGDRWAKCDMVYTMSIERLELVRGHKGQNSKRTSDKGTLPPAVLLAVRVAAAKCLGVHAASFTKMNAGHDKLVPERQELAAVPVEGMPELAANSATAPGRGQQAFA
ncbi:uncharacterized protein YifN (PemK superfamily) [Xanthomonas arboricola]|uniref:type II toxin-antitoxin system PemK/MazF family toxin n=1 Tax=Xanthomonas euroxanthea TaxID=2259622 RepID=UPI0017FA6087|nr:type II toxin-antitoxin system PemK/MazF family toxin [Xanthomonas euroxanthea]MBB3814899.1 uncharacterized protein YifN (PemK superfamily) [Xanthomonas euroxanthea]